MTLDEEDQIIHINIQELTIRGSANLKTRGSKVDERVTIEVPLERAVIEW